MKHVFFLTYIKNHNFYFNIYSSTVILKVNKLSNLFKILKINYFEIDL